MIGNTVLHYRILEELGRGGMGVVYKAEDVKLRRAVALKFLPHHLSATEEEQARFLQEAQAAATLNHPNICTIHAIEEADGQQFIVMEYVDGMTLREKIAGVETTRRAPKNSGRVVSTEDAISYAIQIGEALQEAHSKGIVHRDVKAENIMVNAKNQIKVMDFGLAKLKGSSKLTRTSSTVGTLSYMAPEQIQGGELDARSDIFSFGVVLFEMLTGHTPFRGEHEAAIMYSIVNEEPDSLSKYVPEASSELLHVLNRSLEKDPEDRYQSVHDMVIDLRRLKKDTSKVSRAMLKDIPVPEASTHVEQPTRKSVTIQIPTLKKRWVTLPAIIAGIAALAAVGYFLFVPEGQSEDRIPVAIADFVNQTQEPELDGLSGMLITSMEQSRRLAVLTRSRMFDILRQMGKENVERIDEALGRQICKQANVGALVTASIRKFGKLYTIDLKILDPQKNEYLFTAKEEGQGQESIPSMLDKLSEKTRIGLKERTDEVRASKQKVAEVTTTNLEAYQYFFQGEQLINKLKFKEAEEELNKAVALDSTFGLAYYRLAYALSWSPATNQQANEPIQKALSLIHRIPEKERYLVRAIQAEVTQDIAAGIPILKEMERTYPDDKEMLYNIGDWSFHEGLYDDAIAYLERVLGMDPTNERTLQHLTWTYRDVGQYEKMLEVAKRYVSVAGTPEAYGLLGRAYTFLGQFDTGFKTLLSARELFPKEYSITGSIADLYLSQGNYAQAVAELKPLIGDDKPTEAKQLGYTRLADPYAYVGKYRDALRSIDNSIEINWMMRDTVQALQRHMNKALLILLGLNDLTRSWQEIEKTLSFQEKYGSPFYYGGFEILHVRRGDFATADSLSRRAPPWWQLSVQSLISVAKRRCLDAKALADSASRRMPEGQKFWVLYPLAECLLAEGHIDKALQSLKELQAIRTKASLQAAMYYPKSFYLMGKAYEKKGNGALAIQSYERFLTIWKDADKDLPDLIDAKTRLARFHPVR